MLIKFRIYLAWVLLVGSLIGWPLSAFTFAKTEPITILSISWLALVLTAWDILNTTDVRHKQEKD